MENIKKNMVKKDGKIREQLKREENTRRDYAKKFSFMNSEELNTIYDPVLMDKELVKLVPEEKHPMASFDYTGHGESSFTSKDMYDFMNMCRCGRKKQGIHLLKCVQACKIKYSEEDHKVDPELPKTAYARIGWPKVCKYAQWEKSTYYTSPKTMVKETNKVTSNPYSNIILG